MNGYDEAMMVGLEWLESHYEVELAIDLLASPAARESAAELTRRYLSAAEPFHWGQAVEKLVRYVRDDQLLTSLVEEPQLIEFLHERAFAEEGGFWFVGSKATAVLGLARFDPESAFLAACKAIANPGSHDREYYPYILVELDATKATPVLLELLADEKSTAVIWAISRALAGLDDFSRIADWLSDSRPRARLAACRVCERLHPVPRVLQALQPRLDDADVDVAAAARQALQHLQLAQEAEKLVEALLVEQNDPRRWMLLDSLLAVGDPGDKHRPAPDWFRRVMNSLPHFVRVYFWDRLEKRREEVVQEAKNRDKFS